MRELFHHHKRAISEIVSYVLLISISLALVAIAYPFLKFLINQEVPACPYPEDISIIVKNYSCHSGDNSLTLDLMNKGLRKIDAAYIKIGLENKKVKETINPLGQSKATIFATLSPSGQSLMPGEDIQITYSLDTNSYPLSNPANKYEIEIQPAIFIKGNALASCNPVTQPISCETSS